EPAASSARVRAAMAERIGRYCSSNISKSMITEVSRTPTSGRSPIDTIRPEQLVGFGPHRLEVHSGQAVQSAGHLRGCREPAPLCWPELGYRVAVAGDHDGLAGLNGIHHGGGLVAQLTLSDRFRHAPHRSSS